ncbi:hypothetical protein [uncultured Clostridium sp.]|uniref:hypothetical protein n=1 Tax=uncultured Clostridium sp. TaxID=59620 RepID=UPI0025D39A7C|nr:hypothetical protein [uncultured Clostridium sp.]MDU4883228.1 hypothetical protein [Clostridium celatum]MDU7076958.1 hypothetical protein [Clostridium celatum]
MKRLNYCLDCQRVFTSENSCEYCNSNNIKELKRGKSVNIIGSKDKARYLRYKEGKVSVIVYDENKRKFVKEYDISKIKKVL